MPEISAGHPRYLQREKGMFFKNITAFMLSDAAALALRSGLDEALKARPVPALGALDQSCRGFVPPFGVESLSYDQAGCSLIQWSGLDKVIPASAVSKTVNDRIDKIAQDEDRRVGSKERRRIRDEVLTDMLVKAFVKPFGLAAYIDWQTNLILVNTGSDTAASDLLTDLRAGAGTLPAFPLNATESVRQIMSEWVAANRPAQNFALGDECAMSEDAEGSSVKFARQDLCADEVLAHFDVGMSVDSLGLQFNDRIGFVLDTDLTIRKIRLFDNVMDDLASADDDTAESELAPRFTLMALELRELFKALDLVFKFDRPTDR